MDARNLKLPASLESLRGLRLGRCARRILLLAPGPMQEPSIVLPEREGRAAGESHRRAMRQLAAIGLLELSWKSETVEVRIDAQSTRLLWDADAGVYREQERAAVERTIDRRALKLTALGSWLVDRIRPELETGKRIRWTSIIEVEQF